MGVCSRLDGVCLNLIIVVIEVVRVNPEGELGHPRAVGNLCEESEGGVDVALVEYSAVQ